MLITDYLTQNRVNYQLHLHWPTFHATELARAERISQARVAKAVIVRADGKYYMCVAPACCTVDLEKVRQAVDAGTVRLAHEQELAVLFRDCELGAHPPFGHLYGMTTLLEKSLAFTDSLVFQANTHNQALQLNTQDYLQAARPRVLSLSHTKDDLHAKHPSAKKPSPLEGQANTTMRSNMTVFQKMKNALAGFNL